MPLSTGFMAFPFQIKMSFQKIPRQSPLRFALRKAIRQESGYRFSCVLCTVTEPMPRFSMV